MNGVIGCGGGAWELVMKIKGHKVFFDRQLLSKDEKYSFKINFKMFSTLLLQLA